MTRSHRPLWYDSHALRVHPPLDAPQRVDVCVIGAGITGLSVAYTLARAGRRVLVLERKQVASGESGRTTAHLSSAIDDRFVALEGARGVADARRAAESHAAAIDEIERVIDEEGIDCDFRRVDGFLFLGDNDTRDVLDEEVEAAHRAGLLDASIVANAAGVGTGVALRFPAQARIHPLKYLDGLARAIERYGGRVCGHSKVKRIEGGSPATVETDRGKKVLARDVIVCTNGAISDMTTTHIKQAPYRSFVVALAVKRGVVPDALYWDTSSPYHYARLAPLPDGRDAVIVGGEDHRTGHADDAPVRYARLEEWARAYFPDAGDRISAWSGQVLEPNDYLAYIGANPDGAEHVWLATGDSGMGMTHGTIAGMMMPALLDGAAHPWKCLYSPKRQTLHGAEIATRVRDAVDVAVQLADYVTPGDGEVDDIKRGQGRVIRRGLHKIAAYRDTNGKLHERSAVCTHLKCIVAWNSDENTWDCPCHGSRFDPMGKAVAGPAIENLLPVRRLTEPAKGDIRPDHPQARPSRRSNSVLTDE